MRDEWQIDCSDHGPGVQWLQHGRNVREFTLLVPVVPVGVNSPGSMQTKPKPKKTTCNTSQLSKSIRSKESKGSNLRYLDSGCHDTLEATTMSVSCAEPILFMWVWYLKCWESLKIHWLNYHHCHCPHWSLIYAHCGRKSMSPLSNRPTWIWICTDFFPTHPVFFLISNTSVSKAMATRRASH